VLVIYHVYHQNVELFHAYVFMHGLVVFDVYMVAVNPLLVLIMLQVKVL
jgi:hypothetical protein